MIRACLNDSRSARSPKLAVANASGLVILHELKANADDANTPPSLHPLTELDVVDGGLALSLDWSDRSLAEFVLHVVLSFVMTDRVSEFRRLSPQVIPKGK